MPTLDPYTVKQHAEPLCAPRTAQEGVEQKFYVSEAQGEPLATLVHAQGNMSY